MTALIQWRY